MPPNNAKKIRAQMECVALNWIDGAKSSHTHKRTLIYLLSVILFFISTSTMSVDSRCPKLLNQTQKVFCFALLFFLAFAPHFLGYVLFYFRFFSFSFSFLLLLFRHQLIHYFSKFISIGCLLFCIINRKFRCYFAEAEPFMLNTVKVRGYNGTVEQQ